MPSQLSRTDPRLWLVITLRILQSRGTHRASSLQLLPFSSTQWWWELGPDRKMSLAFGSWEEASWPGTHSKWPFFFLVVNTNSSHSSFFFMGSEYPGIIHLLWTSAEPLVPGESLSWSFFWSSSLTRAGISSLAAHGQVSRRPRQLLWLPSACEEFHQTSLIFQSIRMSQATHSISC